MAKNSWLPPFGEINPKNPNHAAVWREGMDWVRLEVNHNDLKDEFIKWAMSNNVENSSHYHTLPNWHFVTIGRIAYLINRGAMPSESTVDWFFGKIAALPVAPDDVELNDEDETPISAKARRTIDYVNLYSFIDAVLHNHQDDGDKINELLTDRLRKAAPNAPILKKLYAHFKETLADALAEKDNHLVEKTIAPLILAVNILAASSGNAKVASYKTSSVTRKAVKAAEKVTFKAMDASTNMASINPAQIPGTKTAVVYNSKSRKLMVYHAKADEVLNIKGTKIVNFDETTSFAKTLRKPKGMLPMLRNAVTIRRVEVLFGDIKGKNHAVNGRIGKDMVIVKVLK